MGHGGSISIKQVDIESPALDHQSAYQPTTRFHQFRSFDSLYGLDSNKPGEPEKTCTRSPASFPAYISVSPADTLQWCKWTRQQCDKSISEDPHSTIKQLLSLRSALISHHALPSHFTRACEQQVTRNGPAFHGQTAFASMQASYPSTSSTSATDAIKGSTDVVSKS